MEKWGLEIHKCTLLLEFTALLVIPHACLNFLEKALLTTYYSCLKTFWSNFQHLVHQFSTNSPTQQKIVWNKMFSIKFGPIPSIDIRLLPEILPNILGIIFILDTEWATHHSMGNLVLIYNCICDCYCRFFWSALWNYVVWLFFWCWWYSNKSALKCLLWKSYSICGPLKRAFLQAW